MKFILFAILLNACVFKAEFQAKSEKAYGPKAIAFSWNHGTLVIP